MVVAAMLTDSEPVAEPLAKFAGVVLFISVVAWIVARTQMIADSLDKRSRRQLPPRRTQQGQAFEGEQDTGTRDVLVLSEARRDVRARHVPGHGTARRTWRSLPVRRGQRRPGPPSPTSRGMPGIRACITGVSFFPSGWGSGIGCLCYGGRLISGGVGWTTLIKQEVSAGRH